MPIDITSTTFVHQITVIEADWCNDVDELTFEVFPGTGTSSMWKFDEEGNSVLNNTGALLLTSATDGFLMVPATDGTPAGTPTSYTGAAPLTIDSDNDGLYFYSNGAWHGLFEAVAHVETPQWLAFVDANQTAVLTTGTSKATIRAMPACTILAIRGFLATAGSTASTFDVHLNGTTIMSANKLLIDANETTTLTASTAPALTTTAVASGDVITVDVDTAGTDAKGWGVMLQVRWT